MYNVTLRRVRVKTSSVEKQYVLNFMNYCHYFVLLCARFLEKQCCNIFVLFIGVLRDDTVSSSEVKSN